MKIHNIIFPMLASAMLFASCDDQKMEWKTPDGHYPVVSSEIPLALAEEIANYDSIKAYMSQYMPGVTIGIGLGADKYLSDDAYAALCNQNYQQFVTGNAMKHSSVVKNDGSLDFTTINQFMTKVPAGIEVYGHNFIWHTQQNQTYLKSLIAPTMTVKSDGDIANVLKNGDFETGDLTGWSGWGNGSTRTCKSGIGVNGSYGVELVNPKDASDFYPATIVQDLSAPLVIGKTYVVRFKAKSSISGGQMQICLQQPSGLYPAEGYTTFDIGTDWTTCEKEITIASHDNLTRLCLNFAKIAATYTIDNVEFGEKIEDPMDNVLTGDNSDFEGGTKGSWGSWGNKSSSAVSEKGQGYNSDYCMVLTNPTDASQWSAQCAYTFADAFKAGTTYIIQFYAKASVAGSILQFQVQNGSTNGSQEGYNNFTIGTDWTKCEYEYNCTKEDANRILLNFGKSAGTYYIDNVKFGVKKATTSAAKHLLKGTTVTYTFKTAAEKKAALLGAMESWIKGMLQNLSSSTATHCIKQWDVINEPITDGTYQWRGVDGNFSDDDTAPTETQANGLTMDWASGHWYWGYYIGKEYAVDAFKYARQYAPSDCKLYVNDYNLETSPGKLAALIDFVNYIDNNGGKVDGIGTQMHVDATTITQDQVDAMFKTMAATGKLVRISELDVSLKTATPSAEQMQKQSDVYQMILTSYKANVPTAQQGGITIWGLSDAADEHEYWLKDCSPNLYDKNYARKIAYKGVCDGIAGKDIGAGFSGDQWKNYYK